MTQKILVAYATKCGSTAEVAQVIGECLAHNGKSVEAKLIQEVQDVSDYAAFVIGSAIRMAQWLPEAKDFIQKHQIRLNSQPTAIFSVHILNQGDSPEAVKERQAYTAPQKEILNPIAEAFFPGKIDQSQLNFVERGLFKLVKSPEGDFRDWDDILNWANAIAL